MKTKNFGGDGGDNSMNPNMSTNEDRDINRAETNTTLVELVTFAGENNSESSSRSSHTSSSSHLDQKVSIKFMITLDFVTNLGILFFKLLK